MHQHGSVLLPVKKAFLAAASPVLDKLFFSGMEQVDKEVEIIEEEVRLKVFEAFLDHIC